MNTNLTVSTERHKPVPENFKLLGYSNTHLSLFLGSKPLDTDLNGKLQNQKSSTHEIVLSIVETSTVDSYTITCISFCSCGYTAYLFASPALLPSLPHLIPPSLLPLYLISLFFYTALYTSFHSI